MPEDGPYMELKLALIDLEYEDISFWEFVVDFWAHLQPKYEGCITEVWPALADFVLVGFEKITEATEAEDFDLDEDAATFPLALNLLLVFLIVYN